MTRTVKLLPFLAVLLAILPAPTHGAESNDSDAAGLGDSADDVPTVKAKRRKAAKKMDFDKVCPVAPQQSQYKPELRTALASHARTGNTWTRFLLERATGLPTGCEKRGWANVLAHFGGEKKSSVPNKDGVVVKTHSLCLGCWPGANLSDRWSFINNGTEELFKRLKAVRPHLAHRLKRNGACIGPAQNGIEGMLEELLKNHLENRPDAKPPKGKGRGTKEDAEETLELLPCEWTYDRAIVLQRDPLDVFRSNYHYRTEVLGFRNPGTWGKDDYAFPKERARSFVSFYWKWRRFSEVQPVLDVRYEDMKADTEGQLRRMLDFLGEKPAHDKAVTCAVQASSMEHLKQSAHVRPGVNASKFFGSRAETEQREELTYPPELLQYYQEIGLFEVRRLLGYPDHRDDVPGLENFLDKPSEEGRADL